jgi:alpha-1,2-mannosyltransferase
MADTCAATGASTCSSHTGFPFMNGKLLSHVVLPILCLTPLATLILFPLLWRAVGAFLGWYLRKKTDGRRCHILELVEADEKKYLEEKRRSSSSESSGEDGEWEKLDAYTTGTAENGGKGDDDWDGIVGFFHPFW